ncbi:MAG: hypothetical protein H7138_28370 [Myxococcales bacterium]|nr:hypothetical protein [Myxococcales bacterium]
MQGRLTAAIAVAVMSLGAGACGTGDDTTEGTRAECAQGGALTDCPDAQRTAQAACWRMVDCGAISVESDVENRFTWGRCVDTLETQTEARQRVVINCVAASTCAELRVNNSPSNPNPNDMRCLRLGGL